MPRAQGRAGAAHVQDVRYAAGAGTRRSGACTGCTCRFLLLQNRHFRHPPDRSQGQAMAVVAAGYKTVVILTRHSLPSS